MFEDAFYPAYVPVMSAYHFTEGGIESDAPQIVRKCLLKGHKVPDGWYGEDVAKQFEEYTTLAIDTFPGHVSKHCTYVIGPDSAGPGFRALDERDIPYHIRIVKTFDNLPVWVLG